ncbi:MAG TPA: hypothetical protein VK540_27230 [Polyangiaceae bacterium]|jgi:hypothetical protein|nr:hypothetical protein [Polyangiaceae bacterium]
MTKGVYLAAAALLGLAWACGGGSKAQPTAATTSIEQRLRTIGDAGIDDQSRCEFRGRADRDAIETAGPGSVQPNVRRVYQMVGTGESMHKVLICREIDTNFDGIKDIVRTYTEKGESLHEQADTNYDGRIDNIITFSGGHIVKEELDTNFNGTMDVWKYYVGGQLSRIQRDTNGDSRADRWEFYNEGKLERAGVDVDFDGHVDRWDHDEEARLAAEVKERSSDQGAKTADGSSGVDAGPAPTGDLSKLNTAPDGGAPLSASKRKKK